MSETSEGSEERAARLMRRLDSEEAPNERGLPSVLRAYIADTFRLHALILEGKGESDEADALRDRMDGPWRRLSLQEHGRVDRISEALDELTKDL